MTKETAIFCIKGLKNLCKDYFTKQDDIQCALDMAIKALEITEEFEKAQIITGGRLNGRTYAYKCGLEDGKRKALEQQLSDDCVSRKSLLDKLDPLYKEKIKTAPDNMAEGFLQVSNLIKYEPPVTPTRKSGLHWVERFDDTDKWLECPHCHKDSDNAYAYCPNCGAEMRGGENDTRRMYK